VARTYDADKQTGAIPQISLCGLRWARRQPRIHQTIFDAPAPKPLKIMTPKGVPAQSKKGQKTGL
jgi:hypothetical protein